MQDATGFVALFLATPFSGNPRHARRIAMVSSYETDGALPPILGG
jgi:ribose 5-phosphate isomerase B